MFFNIHQSDVLNSTVWLLYNTDEFNSNTWSQSSHHIKFCIYLCGCVHACMCECVRVVVLHMCIYLQFFVCLSASVMFISYVDSISNTLCCTDI